MKKKWIQKAEPKKGALSRQLGVPEDENIPLVYLKDIQRTPIGKTIILSNGIYQHRKIKVTRLLKKRVQFALNVRKRK
jgi:hypothetical protein